MKTSLLTMRFFPLPQPTSRPIDPAGSSFKNLSTMGHGWRGFSALLAKQWWWNVPCNELQKSDLQSVGRPHAHSVARMLLPDPPCLSLDNWDVEE